jgi:acetyl-CoA synthetase
MTLKEMLYGLLSLKQENIEMKNLSKEINQQISNQIGPIAKLDTAESGFTQNPFWKKIKPRKIAEGDYSNFGDISTLLNPEIVMK